MIIEVCDMTLDFCNYVFDIDMVVVTNIGYDHMDVHKSIEHYTEEVGCFIENKVAILNYNDKNLQKIKNESRETYFFNTYKHELNLFGKFNLQNAEAARITCNKLGVLDENIINSLKTFESVEGRTIKINYNDNEIVSGKTDNVDALKAVLEEERFDILIINNYKPDTLIIFPGLEDITYDYVQYLNNIGYTKDMIVLKNIDDILNFINTKKGYKIFVGGNGQEKITQITNILKEEKTFH